MSLKLIIFDFDGTLTTPSALDFSLIRKTLNCPAGTPVLEFIDSLPRPDQAVAREALLRFEMEAAVHSVPNPGAEELILELKERGLKLAIITRNGAAPVKRAFENFRRVRMDDFDLILSRDDPHEPKPHPASVVFALRTLGVDAREALMVGDYVFDIQAGTAAGVGTVYLDTGRHRLPEEFFRDHVISEIAALKPIVRSIAGQVAE